MEQLKSNRDIVIKEADKTISLFLPLPTRTFRLRYQQSSAERPKRDPIWKHTDIIPLVLTHNPNHAIDFNYVKTRLQRAIKNKVILSTRQPANLKRLLTRAEFNPDEEFGVVPCQRTNCDLCKDGYLIRETAVISPTGAILFRLNKKFHCNSKYILYLLTCPVCREQYVGKTGDCRLRMNNHKKDVRNQKGNTLDCDKHFKNCQLEK